MRRYGVDPLEVDTVVLSHLHGDHFAGLPFLLLEGRLVSGRDDPLNIVGPMETGARLRVAMDALFAGSSPEKLPYRVRIREYEATRPVIAGDFKVTAFPALHSPGSNPYAVRVEAGGKVVAYSGDSAWTPGLVEAARGAALFICEAYTRDTPLPNHLDYKTLLEHRDELDCNRIILTHMGAAMLEHSAEVEMEAADDGMTISV
jgi:ribonuclease BN (tRNA processing enzyme)